MKRSSGAVLRLLAATAVVVTALGLGLAAASGSSDPAEPVEGMRSMHDETHVGHGRMHMGGHTSAEMDDMHHQTSARLSEEDRTLHNRMHEGCSDHTNERNAT